jgi:hypothetical protein
MQLAVEHPEVVESYLEAELAASNLAGPFHLEELPGMSSIASV